MEPRDTSLHDLITRTFATFEAKDLDAIMSVFAEDAVVIDPHFATPRMQGKATITEGFQGAMTGIRSFLAGKMPMSILPAIFVISSEPHHKDNFLSVVFRSVPTQGPDWEQVVT
jgi:SnoaL-like domain